MSFEDLDGGYGTTSRSSQNSGGFGYGASSGTGSEWDRLYSSTQQLVQEVSLNVPYINKSSAKICRNFPRFGRGIKMRARS